MQEIKCPNCGQVFQVDESGYAQIVQQVRDREFEKELERRQQEMARQKESDLTVAKMRQEQQHRAALPGASARGKDHREDQRQTNNAFLHLPLRLFFLCLCRRGIVVSPVLGSRQNRRSRGTRSVILLRSRCSRNMNLLSRFSQ